MINQKALDRMLELLKDIQNDATLTKIIPDNILTDEGGYFAEDLDPRIQEVLSLADDALITKEGHPNFRAMDFLKRNCFYIGPGETDSFGWLTGCIYVPGKGSIIYG